MKDTVRKELKELCYFIIENNNALSRPEQLTRVQMLYERLLVLNYLEEVEAEKKAQYSAPKPAAPPAGASAPTAPASPKPAAAEAPKSPEPVAEIKVETPSAPPSAPEPEKPAETETPADNITSEEEKTVEAPAEISRPAPTENKASSAERRDLNDGHQAPRSINDHLAKGAIQVGLNDRIAFVKHLFNDSQADFNRVLSQLNTLDTYLESMYFIENLVKPDYEWEDKKPYEERLINLIKKRFGEDW